jgi:hypothetical protein
MALPLLFGSTVKVLPYKCVETLRRNVSFVRRPIGASLPVRGGTTVWKIMPRAGKRLR